MWWGKKRTKPVVQPVEPPKAPVLPEFNPRTQQLFTRRFINGIISAEMIDWAISMLSENYNGRNLRILAGLKTTNDFFEVRDYFHKALCDLGWSVPPEEVTLHWYCLEAAKAIVDGSLVPLQGLAQNYDTLFELKYPEYMRTWVWFHENRHPEYPHYELSEEELTELIMQEAKILVDKQ